MLAGIPFNAFYDPDEILHSRLSPRRRPAPVRVLFAACRGVGSDERPDQRLSHQRARDGDVPARGDPFRWTFGAARGEGKADAQGLITITGLKITSEPATLGITR